MYMKYMQVFIQLAALSTELDVKKVTDKPRVGWVYLYI